MKIHIKVIALTSLLFAVMVAIYFVFSHQEQVAKTIQVENPILVSRSNETLTLSAELIEKLFPKKEARHIQVKEVTSNQLLPTQAIDSNLDGSIDEFIFQTDLGPSEKKEFEISLTESDSIIPYLVNAAFVPYGEGMDDFTWENDCIGYRFYGETRAQKQATGIAMDIWCKRSSEFLTQKWYTSETSYHEDIGYGADHYSSGKNQGCGGSGILMGDSIYFPKAYSAWKIISSGPIRTVFELTFTGWSILPNLVETKRISLDAGHYFNRIESRYSGCIDTLPFQHAVGVVVHEGAKYQVEKENGCLAIWEFLGEGKGELGTGFIASAKNSADIKLRENHLFSFLHLNTEKKAYYYTGASWSEFGPNHSMLDWEKYVENQVEKIQNPCIITLKSF
jgi:hypothetical protein